MALADVYDALISRRVYQEPFSHVTAVSMITVEAGKQFDPAVVAAFLQLQNRFLEIADTYRDEFSEASML